MRYVRDIEEIQNWTLETCIERFDQYFSFSDDHEYYQYQSALAARLRELKKEQAAA